jgi:hypothetical protein
MAYVEEVTADQAWALIPSSLSWPCWEAEEAVEPFHEAAYGAVCDEVASAGVGWRRQW